MSFEESDNDSDSDVELQRAFERGELKPGLNAVVPLVKKEYINNTAELKNKLEEIKLELEWVERLDLINEPASMTPVDQERFGDLELKTNRKGQIVKGDNEDIVHNDFKREMLFYRQAQATVLEGLSKLQALGIPTKRPEDYFAEMAKSDDHMKKVQENLANKQMSIDRSEKAKKLREMKKFGKKMQNEILQNRQKEKKQMLESIKKYKKGQKASLDFLDENKKSQRNSQNTKRQYKDGKYGFGGRKKGLKSNTAESAADTSSFSRRKFNKAPGKKANKNKCPGKAQRQKTKNRRRR